MRRNEMPRSHVNAAAVIELAPRPRPLNPARRRGAQTGSIVVLRGDAPLAQPSDARAPSDIPRATPGGLKRLQDFFARLIARIDLTSFPGSCCG
jgi:hypothetical protein